MPAPKYIAPYSPIVFVKADASALQAMKRGEATADQQIRAMEFILGPICERNGMSFRPGGLEGDRDTAFAEGKRFVANQIVKMVNTPLSKIKDNPK